MVTFCATTFIDVREGLILGVGFAILTLVFRSQAPATAALARLPDTDAFVEAARYEVHLSLPMLLTYFIDRFHHHSSSIFHRISSSLALVPVSFPPSPLAWHRESPLDTC